MSTWLTDNRRLLLLTGLALLLASVPLHAAPTWDDLRSYYDYDRALPLDPRDADTKTLGPYRVVQFTFAATDRSRVPAALYLPTPDRSVGLQPTGVPAPLLLKPAQVERERPTRLVLFLHGLGGSKDDARLVAQMLCPNGIAILAIDARLHGERKRTDTEFLSPDLERAGQNIIGTIIDNRRALDCLATRSDVHPRKIVLVGVSMGGILGSILTAVEPRIQAAALLVAGGRWDILLRRSDHDNARQIRATGILPSMLRARLASVEPVNFVGHIAPRPLFLANGRLDTIVPPRSAQALQDAAGEPKEVHWYEAGHVAAVIQCLADLTDWLRRQLSPVAQTPVAEVAACP